MNADKTFLLGAVLALAAGGLAGQQFEVASVKVSHLPPPTPSNPIQFSAGPERLTYKNATLRILLTWAYGVKPDQISGPDWLNSERYEITATAPTGATKEQVRLMMQNL